MNSRELGQPDAFNVCAQSGGDQWCWGENSFGCIAEGDSGLPPALVEPYHDIVDFAASASHLCVIRADDSIWCRGWGPSLGGCADDWDWGEVSFEYCDPYAYD